MNIYTKYIILIALLFAFTGFAQGFKDDFTKESINSVPSKWSIVKGEAKIVLVDEKKTFSLEDNTIVTPNIAKTSTNYLKGDFTIEFDVFFDEAATAYRQFYKLRLWEGDGNYGFDGNHADPMILYRHGIRAAGSNGYKSYNRLKELEVNDRVWRHIKVVYKSGGLNVYINDHLLYSNPALFYEPKMVSLGATLHSSVPLLSAFTNFSLIGETEKNDPINSQINYNRNISGEAHEMLKKLLPKGIQSFSFAPNGGWVIITKTNEHFARNIPEECYQKIKDFVQKGTKIEEVVFPPKGGNNSWLIITENSTFARNIPGSCHDKITALQRSGKIIQSVAFPFENVFSDSNDAWSIITTDGNFYVKNIPDECYQIMRNIRQTDMPGKSADRRITKISYGPNNKWIVMAEDYFFYMNMPQDYIEYFNTLRNKEYSPEIIAFDPDGNGWSVTSDKATQPHLTNLIRDIENNIANDRDIWQTMAANNVPGVAIAVVINGKVAWKTAYGHLQANNEKYATHPESMFQGASVSKALAAVGAFKLIDQGKITLDEDLMTTGKLKWEVPFNDCIKDERWVENFNELTIKNILNHRSGVEGRGSVFNDECEYRGTTTGGGCPWYTDNVPTLDELIKDISITYHPNKRPSPNNRMSWYSGKAHTVLQKLVGDVTGKEFSLWMKDEIFTPLKMVKSKFTPYPEQFYDEKDLARGHDSQGKMTEIRRYRHYAAAGIYTNVEELANLIIMLNNKGKFENKRIISTDATSRLINDGTGLNLTSRSYFHGGTNSGYRALFTGFPNISNNGIDSAGIVVLTNGTNNIRELITNAIRREYGW